jgi:23S rRNA pseudouridine1911/1915/1917 synthase
MDGMRVDRAVAMLTGVTRAQSTSLIEARSVAVDGSPVVSRHATLRAGASLRVTLPPGRPVLRPDPSVPYHVVHADEHVVVVDKPAGVVVHPGAGQAGGTLVAGLLARFADLAALSAHGVCAPERPGIVHRLDKGTSGLLVVARTAPAYRSLTGQFGRRSVERRYVALVHGTVADTLGTIDAPVGRSLRTPGRMAVSAAGRPARTAYRVIQRYEGAGEASLVAVTLETGRTHQIRVHMAAIGHPVVGDDRYGRRGSADRLGLPPQRLFLHAYVLGFEHPASGRHVRWETGLAPDLAAHLPGAPDTPAPPLGDGGRSGGFVSPHDVGIG